jgi:hypothetical protein
MATAVNHSQRFALNYEASPAAPTNAARCPSCQAAMAVHRFQRQLGGELTLDLCFACQGIWFDEYESAQLAPAGVLELFRLLHAQHADSAPALAPAVLHCPRCREAAAGLPGQHARRPLRLPAAARNGTAAYSGFCGLHDREGLRAPARRRRNRRTWRARCRPSAARAAARRWTSAATTVCRHCRSPIVVLDPDAVQPGAGRLRPAGEPAGKPRPAGRRRCADRQRACQITGEAAGAQGPLGTRRRGSRA